MRRCFAGVYLPDCRNFRFPGSGARSAEVTASLIEPDSFGIVSARRHHTSHTSLRPLRPSSCRSYFFGILQDVTVGSNPFPAERRWSRRTGCQNRPMPLMDYRSPFSPEVRPLPEASPATFSTLREALRVECRFTRSR